MKTRGAKATSIDGDVSLEDWELPAEGGENASDLLARIMRNVFREALQSITIEPSKASEEFDKIVKRYAADAVMLALQNEATAHFDVDGKHIFFSLNDMGVFWSTSFIDMVKSAIDFVDREELERLKTLLASGITLIDEALT